MNISSTASSATSYISTSSSSANTSTLEKQKAQLEAELQKISSSKDDEKTKETKTKQLQLQIKQIEAQITGQSSQGGGATNGTTGSKEVPPAQPPSTGMNVATAKEIANATTDSNGRFDIRI
ncbi:FlxA-like family protein [Paenibacillus sp. 7516]|uniref:FlxA-like family protein n=1 Tax=Paenibacillus sp. 7516 TaxID=2022549 RepID=UPI000BA58EEF|nr:FlxA-like family protein [Paenibacillus sp. 7516]PAF28546.1 hypothetical protein CHI14_27765 [Paenibacillus sp. 7516]